jgi:hypothetical protein
LFANNELTAFTADDTDTNTNTNINAKTNTNIKKSNTNTTIKKKAAKKSTTTTKEPNSGSVIRKFVPPHLDVSFCCFHLIIFIKLIFNIFIIFSYQPMEMPLASTSSSSSRMETPSTGASLNTFSSRQLQSKKTAEGAFIV